MEESYIYDELFDEIFDVNGRIAKDLFERLDYS